jgi:hypothetical protein
MMREKTEVRFREPKTEREKMRYLLEMEAWNKAKQIRHERSQLLAEMGTATAHFQIVARRARITGINLYLNSISENPIPIEELLSNPELRYYLPKLEQGTEDPFKDICREFAAKYGVAADNEQLRMQLSLLPELEVPKIRKMPEDPIIHEGRVISRSELKDVHELRAQIQELVEARDRAIAENEQFKAGQEAKIKKLTDEIEQHR